MSAPRALWLADPPGSVAVLEARGRDAVSFLHRMLTQDVKGMPEGSGRRACLLSREGKVLADLVVRREADGVRLVLDPAGAARARAALERHVVADDVVFEDASPAHAHGTLFGEGAGTALAAAGAEVPSAGRTGAFPAAGPGARVLRRDLGAVPAFEVLARAGGAEPAGAAGRALLAVPGVAAASRADLEAVRVAEGVARAGAEVDERVLPNEAGLEDAISWTKGCYLGQEPVVMARHRGRPPTLLVRLEREGARAGDGPAAGTALLEGERRVGRVTTSARGVGALAYVRHDLAREGAAFLVEGSGETWRIVRVVGR